ncbi:MAG: response regulator [Dehalococcoidia bacterium]|nr:response regulator [Dehalococcoidia bacterium]
MRKRVLIADDEENVLKLISATLGYDERYEITLAHDGEEALDIASRERPDLVILDMLMPKLDGPAVCRALKADPSTAHVKVIFLTALTQESERQKALRAGADHFLTKPFSPTTLLLEVERMLNGD